MIKWFLCCHSSYTICPKKNPLINLSSSYYKLTLIRMKKEFIGSLVLKLKKEKEKKYVWIILGRKHKLSRTSLSELNLQG